MADFTSPTRDQLIADYLRDFRFACNGAQSTDPGSQAYIDACAQADLLLPQYLRRDSDARALDMLASETIEQANEWARSLGQPEGQPATPSTGYVTAQVAQGGSTVFKGDELKTTGGVRLGVLVGKTLTPANPLCAVQSLDTGPTTNLAPGTKVQWTAPRPGCLPDATVWGDAQGQGLIGGRLAETPTEVVNRLAETLADPASASNDAAIRDAVRRAGRSLGIPVQAVFTYPAILAPGTTCVAFTVLPTRSGGLRIPSSLQIDAIESAVKEQFPDGSLFFASLSASNSTLAIKVAWRDGVTGWADLAPWPAFILGTTTAIQVTAVTSTTSFTVGRASGGYGGVTAPTAGKTIALYDKDHATFVRKRILSVSGTGPWVLTIDTAANVSDAAYLPVIGQRVSPWSDSLPLVVPPLCAEYDQFGPGEQVASFYDEGLRQRRQPRPEAAWDSRLGSRTINGVQDLPAVLDAQLVDPAPSSLPFATAIGTPGTLSYLRSLKDLAVFPLT